MQRQKKFGWTAALTLAGLATATMFATTARAETQPRLYLNQTYAEDATRQSTLDVKDPMAVFKFVFGKLPERVRSTRPRTTTTSNSSIAASGMPATCASPSSTATRASAFAYFEGLRSGTVINREQAQHPRRDRRGVAVEKLDALAYRVRRRQDRVFALNDLRDVKPPPGALPRTRNSRPDLRESAMQFFLVFNPKLRLFHYLLDETVEVADQFFAAGPRRPHPVGKRTGFAFYRDHKLNRKILIGVFEGNTASTTISTGRSTSFRTTSSRARPARRHPRRRAAAQGPDRPLRQRAQARSRT